MKPIVPDHDDAEAMAMPPRFLAVQLAIAVLTVATLVVLLAEETVTLSPEVRRVIQWFDVVVCAIFFLDFCVRLVLAENRLAFMKWGWIDLIACIPSIDLLRVGRLVRLLRIIRLVRSLRATHRLFKLLLRNRANSTLAIVVMTMLLVSVFASVAILIAEENGADTNIRTAEDAIWWSLTTITTVGYGDRFPVTTEGRVLAIVLMFCGIGFFGTLSGLIATWLLGKDHDESPDTRDLLRQIELLRVELRQLSPRSYGGIDLQVPPTEVLNPARVQIHSGDE